MNTRPASNTALIVTIILVLLLFLFAVVSGLLLVGGAAVFYLARPAPPLPRAAARPAQVDAEILETYDRPMEIQLAMDAAGAVRFAGSATALSHTELKEQLAEVEANGPGKYQITITVAKGCRHRHVDQVSRVCGQVFENASIQVVTATR